MQGLFFFFLKKKQKNRSYLYVFFSFYGFNNSAGEVARA